MWWQDAIKYFYMSYVHMKFCCQSTSHMFMTCIKLWRYIRVNWKMSKLIWHQLAFQTNINLIPILILTDISALILVTKYLADFIDKHFLWSLNNMGIKCCFMIRMISRDWLFCKSLSFLPHTTMVPTQPVTSKLQIWRSVPSVPSTKMLRPCP